MDWNGECLEGKQTRTGFEVCLEFSLVGKKNSPFNYPTLL